MKEGYDNPSTVVSIAGIAGLDRIEAGPPPGSAPSRPWPRSPRIRACRSSTPPSPPPRPARQRPDPQHGDPRGQPLPAPALLVLPPRGVRLPQEGRKGLLRVRGREPQPRDLRHGPALLLHPPLRDGHGAHGLRRPARDFLGERPEDAAHGQVLHRPVEDATRENTLAKGEIVAAVALPAPARGSRSVIGSSRRRSPSTGRSSRSASCSGCRAGRSATPESSSAPSRRRPTARPRPRPFSPARSPRRSSRGGPRRPPSRTSKPLSQNGYKVRLARVELERALREAFA